MYKLRYEGIQTNKGIIVEEEDAFDYALEQITNDEDEKKAFIEWFFSGNWIEREENK